MNRPFSFYILCILHLFPGLSAVTGGAMLIVKPDGSLLGKNQSWPDHAPFKSYLLPGLTYSLYTGIMLIAWIAFQIVMTQYLWLQHVIIFLGLLIIIFTMMPGTIKFLNSKTKSL